MSVDEKRAELLRKAGMDQLDVTFVVGKKDGSAYTTEEKNALLHRLIEMFDGVQCQATGTVVIDLGHFLDNTAQLWIHDWED